VEIESCAPPLLMRRDWPGEWQAEVRGLQTQLAGERNKVVQERRRTDTVREESKVMHLPRRVMIWRDTVVGTLLLFPPNTCH